MSQLPARRPAPFAALGRNLIGLCTALAIGIGGLTAAATPARAELQPGQVLAGAAALAIVGAAIHSSNKDRRAERERAEAERRWQEEQRRRNAHWDRGQPQRRDCVRLRNGAVECGVALRPGARKHMKDHRQPPRHGWHQPGRGPDRNPPYVYRPTR